MDLSKIQNLIKFVSKSGVSEVNLETEEFKINIKTAHEKSGNVETTFVPAPTPVAVPATPVAAAPAAPVEDKQEQEPTEDNSNYVTVKSPMIGTFYRSPSPDKPVFVNVGDSVEPGKVTCIIEAMKLFNEIESEVSGKIVKVLVDDATPVEYDQPLFLVDPS